MLRMRGMDMGPGTDVGSLTFFAGTWTAMMAAMMLPSALPAILVSPRRRASVRASTAFAASYTPIEQSTQRSLDSSTGSGVVPT